MPYSSLNLCFAHYGLERDGTYFLRNALRQLDEWLEILSKSLQSGIRDEAILSERILQQDERLKPFSALPKDIQERERYFIANSIRGMVGYLQNA